MAFDQRRADGALLRAAAHAGAALFRPLFLARLTCAHLGSRCISSATGTQDAIQDPGQEARPQGQGQGQATRIVWRPRAPDVCEMTADASGDGSEPERFREAIKSGDLATVESVRSNFPMLLPPRLPRSGARFELVLT